MRYPILQRTSHDKIVRYPIRKAKNNFCDTIATSIAAQTYENPIATGPLGGCEPFFLGEKYRQAGVFTYSVLEITAIGEIFMAMLSLVDRMHFRSDFSSLSPNYCLSDLVSNATLSRRATLVFWSFLLRFSFSMVASYLRRGRNLGHSFQLIQRHLFLHGKYSEFIGWPLVLLWIYGVWNGHGPQSQKFFFFSRIFQSSALKFR